MAIATITGEQMLSSLPRYTLTRNVH